MLISSAAVLTPMPGTPGTLSTASPQSACTSITLSGVTPNFSNTSSGPIQRSGGWPGRGMVSSRRIEPSGSTSCIRSLSDETIVTLPPASRAMQRIGRDDVVGLPALHLDRGQIDRRAVAARVSGNCGTSSSGGGGRCALYSV